MTTSDDLPPTGAPQGRRLSRREFLRALAVGGAAAIGGAALAGCAGGAPAASDATAAPASAATSAPAASAAAMPATAAATSAAATVAVTDAPTTAAQGSVDVTLLTGKNDFWGTIPAKEEQAKDPVKKATADVIDTWLQQNPGVKIDHVDVDIWNQQALTTAIAGGTAPTWFVAGAIANYDLAGIRAAFAQGLIADITPQVQQLKVAEKLVDYVRAAWEGRSQVDGKFYEFPEWYNVGMGVLYRRDLIKAQGLKEPQPGWTWDDFRALARALTNNERKGLVVQKNVLGNNIMATNRFDLLTTVPDPDSGWHWKRDFSDPAQIKLAELYRAMMFEDKSVLADVSFNVEEVRKAFANQQAAMMIDLFNTYLGNPTDPNSLAAVAAGMNKPLDEVFGVVVMPVGVNGAFGGTQGGLGGVSFNPGLSPEGLEKAVGLVNYMRFGEGRFNLERAKYEATKDLRSLDWLALEIQGKTTIEGVPGTMADAWGQGYVAASKVASSIPIIPVTGSFFPVEKNPGPTDDALNDLWSKIMYEPGVNVAEAFKQAETTLNQQYAGFSSSASKEDFVAAAKKYYAAHDAFWKQNAPTFYQQVYKPWYDQKVAPVLG